MSLFKTAAKVGVATSVHGRVQRRQSNRWAQQDAAAAQSAQQAIPVAPAAAPAPVAAAPAVDFDTKLSQLKQLGELRDAGILTEAEFEIKKAEILRQ